MILSLYIGASLIAVTVAYYLRLQLSGPQLGYLKSFACLAFNLFFVTYHLRWFKREYLLFVGYTPDLFDEHLSLQWLIFGCLILHCFANPVGWKLRRWYSPW